MGIVGPGTLRRVWACFGLLVLGNAALGEEQSSCGVERRSAEWQLSVARHGATISFPRDASSPSDDDRSTTAVRIGMGRTGKLRGSLTAGIAGPKASLPSLPAKGAATAILSSRPEGGISVPGTFSRVVSSSDFRTSAGGDGMHFLFPLSARDAAVLEAFLTKADQQGRELQMTVLAGRQTVIQYTFRASGLELARKMAVETIAELDARWRAKRCVDLPLVSGSIARAQ